MGCSLVRLSAGELCILIKNSNLVRVGRHIYYRFEESSMETVRTLLGQSLHVDAPKTWLDATLILQKQRRQIRGKN